MADLSAQDWDSWIGKTEETIDRIDALRVLGLAATLGQEIPAKKDVPLPPGGHWMFFNPFVPAKDLGVDGHPRRGGFLPPIQLPRRMWAGSRISYLLPLHIGDDIQRRGTIKNIQSKKGQSGDLVFVTVEHSIFSQGVLCIREEQDIVFREGGASQKYRPVSERAVMPAPKGTYKPMEVTFDPVSLFRYSALTGNCHRIHYDASYARNDEGYPDLVVHGPFIATLMQVFAQNCYGQRPIKEFSFRGVSPLFVHQPATIEAADSNNSDELHVWMRGPNGDYTTRGTAKF